MGKGDSRSERLHQRKPQDHASQRINSTSLPDTIWQSKSARLQVTRQNLDLKHPKHTEAITQYLQSQSSLLDLVAIQLSQQLIKIHGQELDQKLTSEIILIHIKNLVKEIFEKNSIWQEVAKEIWSSLISRSIQDMQRDLGGSVLESLDLAGFNAVLFQYLFDQESVLFISRINHLEAFYARTIVAKIIQDLDLTNQPQSALTELLGLESTNVHEQLSVSRNQQSQLQQIVAVPTNIPLNRSVSQFTPTSIPSQLQADLWQSDTKGVAYARYRARNNHDHYLEHYITSSGDIKALPWEAAEQIINKHGLDTAKLHFLLAAHAMRSSSPWESTFILKVSDILTELGWDSTNDIDVSTKCSQVAHMAYALSCLLIKAVWIEGQAEGQTNTSTLGRLWEILIHTHGQLDWRTGKIEKPEDITITVRPGLGIVHLLNRESSQAREALYQLGNLARSLLQLDPYDNELALRLMIHLMLNARSRASDLNPYEYQVRPILAAVLSEDAMQQIQASGENGRSMFDRWSHALNLLGQLGWHPDGDRSLLDAKANQSLVFYTKPYPRWLEPESSFRKPRGWVDYWLEQRLVIKPPTPEPDWIATVIRSNQIQQQTLQLSCPTSLTGAEVRTARQASKLTQTELATLLQVHQSLIARIESGDRTITPTLEALLRQVLGLECKG